MGERTGRSGGKGDGEGEVRVKIGRGVIVASCSISTVSRSFLTPRTSNKTATWREEMNDEEGTARAR